MGKINLSKKSYKANDTLKKNTGCIKVFGNLNGEETPNMLAYRIAIGIVFDEYDTIPKRLSDTLVSFLKAETFETTTTDEMVELMVEFIKEEVEKRFRLKNGDDIREWFSNGDYIDIPTLIDFVTCIVQCGLYNLINCFLAKPITKCLHATYRELVGIIMLIVHQ